jgi:hypothetical protein
MKLSLAERLLVKELLPKEDDWAGVKEIRKAREILSFTPEEMEKYGIVQEGQMIKWSVDGNSYESDLPMSEWITTQIQEVLRKKNKEKKLSERDISVYQKFIVDYDAI